MAGKYRKWKIETEIHEGFREDLHASIHADRCT